MMAGALSLPVVWSEDGGPTQPGRLDLTAERLHFDGGSRNEPYTRDIALSKIESVRIARRPVERLSGRSALVVELRDGRRVSIASLDRPGTLLEFAERLQQAIGLSP
ncbi:MAG: PH domain-containing protein [Gaiellaceae bacterium]|jgi:hypothetical protein